MSAIQERLVQLSVMLSGTATRQQKMLLDLKTKTAALAPTTTNASLVRPDKALLHPATKATTPTEFLLGPPVQPSIAMKFSMPAPATCSTEWCHANAEVQPSVFAQEATPSASLAVVMLDGELGVSDDKAHINEVLTNVGGLSLFMEPCVDVVVKVEKMPPEYMLWDDGMSGHVLTMSAAVPSEPLLNPPMQLFAVFEPDNPTLQKCSTKCFGDDVSKAMSMFSRVPICDDAEAFVRYVLFNEGLHHDEGQWQPYPPHLQVWISHKRHICRPGPWPSFACNRRDGLQMTFASVSR